MILEVGAVPPSVHSHINVLTFYRRLAEMPGNTIIKQVFTTLRNLHNQGFRTWVLSYQLANHFLHSGPLATGAARMYL